MRQNTDQPPAIPTQTAAPAAPPPLPRALHLRLFPSKLALLLGALAIAFAPTLTAVNPYYLFLLSSTLVVAIAVLGQAIVTGYCGQSTFAGAAFFATGCYSVAIALHAGIAFALALLIAALAAGSLAILSGLPTSRVSGSYLIVMTVVTVTVVQQMLDSYHQAILGAVTLQVDTPAWLSADTTFYYLTLAIFLAAALALHNIAQLRSGRAFRATREAEQVVAIFGIDPASTRTYAYALSGIIIGVAGGLQAILINSLAPSIFGLSISVLLITGVVVGALDRYRLLLAASVATGIIPVLFGDLLPDPLFGVSTAQLQPVVEDSLLLIAILLLVRFNERRIHRTRF